MKVGLYELETGPDGKGLLATNEITGKIAHISENEFHAFVRKYLDNKVDKYDQHLR